MANLSRRGVHFLQCHILGDDLALGRSVCATFTDPSVELTAPTAPTKKTLEEQHQTWRRRRKLLLAQAADAFVLPDDMAEAGLESVETSTLLARARSKSTIAQPESLKFRVDRLCAAIDENLLATESNGYPGLSPVVLSRVQREIKRGIRGGRLPLVTW
jgi:hypothetical protein